MSTNRPRRMNQSTAEQLLARGPVASPGDHDALAGLLDAAAAPAAENELAGEQAALAAFRAARLDPAPAAVAQHPTRRRPVRTPTLARLLSAKVAAVAVATALGGVAVAAGTGHLPAALGGDPVRSEPGPVAASAAPTPGAGASETAPPSVMRRPVPPVPPDLVELCRAYLQAMDAHPPQVPAEQRFDVLVAAAGGREGVPRYCAPAPDDPGGPGHEPTGPEGRPPAGRPSGHPAPGQEPGSRPTTPGTARTHTPPNPPGDRPTSPPDGRPDDPTGRSKG